MLDFEDAETVIPLTPAQRTARFRATQPERREAQRAEHRRSHSQWETNASYLRKPFVAWDGEGITLPDTAREQDEGSHTQDLGEHLYVMFAVKSDVGSDYIANPRGLGTAELFEFILDYAEQLPKGAINVIYGGGYDFNMMMRDIPREDVEKIYKQKYHVWEGYRIGWIPGKSFYLSRIDAGRKRAGKGITIYDVVSFFQCTFVKACDAYLGDNFHERDLIVKNKALRSSFTAKDIPEVRAYNDAELVNLIALMVELRDRLNKANLRPARWDGPGAVAASLMSRERVKLGKADVPKVVAQAARYAYAGGRFEVVKFGHVEETVYEYDINSAYPTALRTVPDLSSGTWKYRKGDAGPKEYALYHVRYSGNRTDLPGALFRRDANGSVCYPMRLTGWYWSPEIETAREYCARGYGTMEILETRWFEAATDNKPFGFIDGLYNKRRALKKAGDGAHVAYKLALNSMYGKCMQQVGWERKADGTLKIPPFHQLEWAGFATSFCRATVLRACLDNLENVIAFETDAVFTNVPLDVTIGEALGDFEATVFNNLTYVQSGMYFAETDKDVVVKSRGVDKCRCPKEQAVCDCGSLTRTFVLERLAEQKVENRVAVVKLTRFVGAGVALAQNWTRWRRWEVTEKTLTLEPTGKRLHMDCECMTVRYGPDGKPTNKGIELGYWHATSCPMMNDSHSEEFPVEWLNPDPRMRELEEKRNQVADYE